MRLFSKLLVFALLPIATAFADTFQIAVIDLKNIQCYACMHTVKKALEKVPGVNNTQLDLDKKTATVKFDPAKTNAELLIQATAKAGFPSSLRKKGHN